MSAAKVLARSSCGSKGDRNHRLHRPCRQQVPGQDRLRPRQAARLRRAGPGRGRLVPRRQAGAVHLRRRQGRRGPLRQGRLPPDRRSPARRRGRTDAPLRRRGPAAGRLARGIDARVVDPVRERKRLGGNTFETDISAVRRWRSGCGRRPRGGRPAQGKQLCGSTRYAEAEDLGFPHPGLSRSLGCPTQLAGKIFGAARDLLEREINGTRYRLLGVGVSALADAEDADPADLINHCGERRAAAERAMDRVRDKFGHEAMVKGLAPEGAGTTWFNAQKKNHKNARRLRPSLPQLSREPIPASPFPFDCRKWAIMRAALFSGAFLVPLFDGRSTRPALLGLKSPSTFQAIGGPALTPSSPNSARYRTRTRAA